MSPTRRQILTVGVGLGALAAFGGARRILVAPEPSGTLASVDELAAALYAGLIAAGQDEACLAYEHPLRQYYNRGLPTNGPWVTFLPYEVRHLVVDLVHASLSEKGRGRVLKEQYMDWLGLHATKVLCFGDPNEPPYQIHLSGPHLYLRIGGRSDENVAFGGAQVWGDQHGNSTVGLPGNVYRDQLLLGQALFAGLPKPMRTAARMTKAPVQTAIDIQGPKGRFEGIPVGEMPAMSRAQVRDFITAILNSYAEPDAAYAWECIEANGGVETFHAADYDIDHQGGRRAGDGASQIFRLESPAAVFHWRGEPHLHAFLNVVMDGEHPLSVGEVVGQNPRAWGTAEAKAFFEEVMAAEMGTPHAYYPESEVAGRLRAGTIRSGDIYALENWGNRVAVMEVAGSGLPESMRTDMTMRAETISDTTRYRIAVPDYVARNTQEMGFVGGALLREGRLLRDAAIEHLQSHGFANSI